MKKKRIICLVLLAVVLVLAAVGYGSLQKRQNGEFGYDFRYGNWGDSKEEIQARETETLGNVGTDGWECNVKFLGDEVSCRYNFDDGRMFAAYYSYAANDNNRVYKKWKRYLESKYDKVSPNSLWGGVANSVPNTELHESDTSVIMLMHMGESVGITFIEKAKVKSLLN